MGTRNLVIVYYKGQYRIAQYGQWDGCPSGQGLTVLCFVANPANIARLKAALDATDPPLLYEPTAADFERWGKQWEEQRRCEEEMENSLCSHARDKARGDPNATTKPWAAVLHNTGAHILEIVARAGNTREKVPIRKELEFVADTLFCEWAYVVDLDAEVVETYSPEGGSELEGPDHSRFRAIDALKEKSLPSLVHRYSLTAVPSKEDFITAFR